MYTSKISISIILLFLSALQLAGFSSAYNAKQLENFPYVAEIVEAETKPLPPDHAIVFEQEINDKTYHFRYFRNIDSDKRDSKLQAEWICYIPGAKKTANKTKYFAAVTGLKPEMEMQYRSLHQAVWPGVMQRIKESNIKDFSIYISEIDKKLYLFYYFEYVGDDFDADMAAMGSDPVTPRWWKFTDPCQDPLPKAKTEGKTWTDMKRISQS